MKNTYLGVQYTIPSVILGRSGLSIFLQSISLNSGQNLLKYADMFCVVDLKFKDNLSTGKGQNIVILIYYHYYLNNLFQLTTCCQEY